MRLKFYVPVLLLLTTAFSANAWTVRQVQGIASLQIDGQFQPLKAGLALQPDQTIVTGKDGRVQLREGNSEIWISSSTEFKLGGATVDVAKKKLVLLEVLRGKVRARFQKLPDETESPFKVKMRTVVCGVRGTEFFAAVGTEDEKVCTLEGHVVVTKLDDENTKWELPVGKGLFLTKGQTPEVKETSPNQMSLWVTATSAASVYSLPWQLRSIIPTDSFRIDSAFTQFNDASGNSGGTATASMLTGSYRFQDRYSLIGRFGITNVSPPTQPAGTSYSNPLLGLVYAPETVSHFKPSFFLGMTVPVGTGSGNAPDAGVKNANLDGPLARSGMDNALFAVNYYALIPGFDFAYIENGLTAQLEATLFQLYRVGGEQIDKDAARTNFTSGLELGYEVWRDISMIGELHYQRWLSNDTVFAAALPAIENLSYAIGPRFTFHIGDVILKPGIAYERGLVGPMVSGGFSSPANSEQIIFVDVPILF